MNKYSSFAENNFYIYNLIDNKSLIIFLLYLFFFNSRNFLYQFKNYITDL